MGFWKKLESRAVLLQTSLSSQECWDVSVEASGGSQKHDLNLTPVQKAIWHRKQPPVVSSAPGISWFETSL